MPTLSYTWRLKKVPLSGEAFQYRKDWQKDVISNLLVTTPRVIVALRLVNSPSKTLDTQAYRAERLELRQNGIQGQQVLTRKYWLHKRCLQCSTDAFIHHEQRLSVGHHFKNLSSLSTDHSFLVQCRCDRPSCFLILWFLFRQFSF